MPDHDCDRAGDRKPLAVETRLDPDERQVKIGQHPDREHRLAYVDRDHAERELPSLGPKRIRAARVTAAERADIDAAQPPE